MAGTGHEVGGSPDDGERRPMGGDDSAPDARAGRAGEPDGAAGPEDEPATERSAEDGGAQPDRLDGSGEVAEQGGRRGAGGASRTPDARTDRGGGSDAGTAGDEPWPGSAERGGEVPAEPARGAARTGSGSTGGAAATESEKARRAAPSARDSAERDRELPAEPAGGAAAGDEAETGQAVAESSGGAARAERASRSSAADADEAGAGSAGRGGEAAAEHEAEAGRVPAITTPESGPEPADKAAEPPASEEREAESDPEPAAASTRRRRFLRTGARSPAGLLIGLLIGLLGFGLAVQVRSNTSTSGLTGARQEDLVRILDELSSREDRLRRQIAELEAARTRLSTSGDRSTAALEEARKRSTALGVLAGTLPAQGPGIELTLTDPEGRLAAEDLLDAVEELRAAGAEALQVGGVRIGLDSSFTTTDRGIAVDGVLLSAPYTILAIGDPQTLATAMEIPGGVSDTVGRAGGEARIGRRERVVIRALRTLKEPQYSRPSDGGR